MKLSKRWHQVYDCLISALAIAAVVLIVIDFSTGLNDWQTLLNRVIYVIFVVDYVVRLFSAKNKRYFVVHNICDLIAILPFHGIFRGFKIVRVNQLLKLLNLPRIVAFSYRPTRKFTRFLNTNGFKYVLFVTALIILLGGVLIHFAEGMSIGDGIWWAFVTATTVGYGDISPHTIYGRLIATVLMLVGIGLIGSVTSTLTSYFLKQQHPQSVHQKSLQLVQEQLEHFDQLSEEDVEELCRLLKALKQGEE